ncbi:putative 60S ribosomal protein L7a [Cardiosporidium cionae]|uniref:60S ribosomal protein L7a n=1 Tax=Cardiosporidium cionae TaxID=476202 RepID=A0ABQ7J8K6_9APIC|nr:putative 60S ribosomal protein L7a [Cardiosporidium cionae]|eukprot:KAF8820328.1 putative 60S ribosomal protein L7a [Cardiosporidium cionae]
MEEDSSAGPFYLSPISSPLLEGKALERSLRLIKKAVVYERESRQHNKQSNMVASKATVKSVVKEMNAQKSSSARCLKRGVQEVTKSLRKGSTGILFLAADVYPVDIIAHLPILCEEKDILYAYLGSKKTLGMACRSKRATSAILVQACPRERQPETLQLDDTNENDYSDLYKKVRKAIQSIHPHF